MSKTVDWARLFEHGPAFETAAEAASILRHVASMSDAELERVAREMQIEKATASGLRIAAREACQCIDRLLEVHCGLTPQLVAAEYKMLRNDPESASGPWLLLHKIRGWSSAIHGPIKGTV